MTGGVRIGAVESQRVEMKVQVQRRAEALDEGDGAALLGKGAPLSPNAPPQLREERPEERAKDFARELGIVCTAVAKWVWESEHPLANRHRGEDTIHEVSRGVGHAVAAAGRTEATALARERHKAVVTTLVAAQTQKTVGEDAAAQEGPKLLLDESRRRLLSGSCACEERLELFANDAVQRRPLRRSRCVGVLRVFVNRVGCRVCRGRPSALAGDRAGGSVLRHRTRSDATRVSDSPVPAGAITSDRAFAFTH